MTNSELRQKLVDKFEIMLDASSDPVDLVAALAEFLQENNCKIIQGGDDPQRFKSVNILEE